jgi:hypothetical protein
MSVETAIRRALAGEPDHAALARLSGLIGDLSEGAAATPVRRPRQVRAAVLGAAAVVALVAAGLLAAAHWPKGDVPSGVAARPPTAAQLRPVWRFTVAEVPGFAITRANNLRIGSFDDVTQTARIASAARPGPQGIFVLSMLAAGYRGADKDGGDSIGVGPHPGVFVGGKRVAGASRQPAAAWTAAEIDVEAQPRLYWQYADGTWGSLQGDFGFRPASSDYDNAAARALMTKIALAIRVGVEQSVRAPFAVSALPAHLAPEGVRVLNGVPCLGYGNGTGSSAAMYRGEWAGSVMTVCRVRTGASRQETLAAVGIVESQTASTTVRDLSDGTSLIVEVDAGKQRLVSREQAARLAASADVTPRLADPATWLPVG